MMHEFQDKKPGFEKVCHGLLEVLLVYISRKQNLSVITNSSFQLSKECALAKRYIDINYSKNITLDSLAEITHINKFIWHIPLQNVLAVSDQLSDRQKN